MTTAIEKFHKMVVKHCDGRGTELAKTGVMEHCADNDVEHCDDHRMADCDAMGHGVLC